MPNSCLNDIGGKSVTDRFLALDLCLSNTDRSVYGRVCRYASLSAELDERAYNFIRPMLPLPKMNTWADGDLWIEIIDLYKEHACLWKAKSKECMNKSKMHKAYMKALEKLQKKESTATISELFTREN